MLSRIEVAKILQEYANEAKLPHLFYTMNEFNKITIYTDRPGILIGKAGSLVNKYIGLLNELVTLDNKIITEINKKREMDWEKSNPTIPENKGCPPSLPPLLQYECKATISFEEVDNSFTDSTYDPMSECM